MTKHHRHHLPQPWGLAIGLLTGCVVTLIGVVLDLQPDTILFRALVGGGLVGSLIGLVAWSWQLTTPMNKEED